MKNMLFRYERVDVRSVGTQTVMELSPTMGMEKLKKVSIIFDDTFM